jgi:hypothetical protein
MRRQWRYAATCVTTGRRFCHTEAIEMYGYLYRAVDSTGATIDFLLSAKRDAAAAERFLAKALGGENHPAPRSSTPTSTLVIHRPSCGSKPRRL